MIDLGQVRVFDWDNGNACKSEAKHGASMAEAEQVFFKPLLLLLDDDTHSQREPRLHTLGKTDEGRPLHIACTLRTAGQLIRVISARDMHRMERLIYGQTSQDSVEDPSQTRKRKRGACVLGGHDSTEHLDWSKAQRVSLPNLKPTTKTISLRLPQHLLDSIKTAANSRDGPYQSLVKLWLQEKLHNN